MIDTLFRYRDQSRLALHAFVVMPDHLHALLTPSSDQTIERCVQLINQFRYVANNPIRKNYPHVHTAYEDRLDTIPTHLKVDAPCS